MGLSHLTPKRGQPQLNNSAQHTAGNSCSIHYNNEWVRVKAKASKGYTKAALQQTVIVSQTILIA